MKAPFDGVVSARLADPGDLALPGRAILKLVGDGPVRIRARLPAEDFPSLRLGASVSCRVMNEVVPAEVSRIFPAMEQAHLAVVEVVPEGFSPVLVSGAQVALDITLETVTGLTVPSDALLEGERNVWVFPVRDGRVHPVPVRLLGGTDERVVVSGDIRAGEEVVVGSPSRLMLLSEGMAVETALRDAS